MKKNLFIILIFVFASTTSSIIPSFAQDLQLSDIISGDGSVSATGGGTTTTISGNASTGNFTTTTTNTLPSNLGTPSNPDPGSRTVNVGFGNIDASNQAGTMQITTQNPGSVSARAFAALNAPVPIYRPSIDLGSSDGNLGFDTDGYFYVADSSGSSTPFLEPPSDGQGSSGGDSNDTFSAGYQALSDLPEVTKISPGRNSSGTNPGTSFVLTFSEPMDKDTVEDNFQIRSFDPDVTDDPSDFNDDGGSQIWDDSAFDVDWNSDDTEVTFTFTNERQLPTDKDTENTPDYLISFSADDGAGICDKSGICRSGDYFKLTDGNFEKFYKFSIQGDGNIGAPPAASDGPTFVDLFNQSGNQFGDGLGPNGVDPIGQSPLGVDIFGVPGGPGAYRGVGPNDNQFLLDPGFFIQAFNEQFGIDPISVPNELPN